MAINDATQAIPRFKTKTVRSFEVTLFAASIALFAAFFGGYMYGNHQPAGASPAAVTSTTVTPTTTPAPGK